MKDLFVLVADSDAEATMGAVLVRHQALGIRPISFTVFRHVGRDCGMVKDGPELARLKVRKQEYGKLLLMWDHSGSGWESKGPEEACRLIQQRLDGVTWKDCSAAVVLVPEIEEWLCHDSGAIARHFRVPETQVGSLAAECLRRRGCLPGEQPKEVLENLFYRYQRRRPRPGDFRAIAECASLRSWQTSESFARLSSILQTWFPPAP